MTFGLATALMYDLTILAVKGATIYFAWIGFFVWVNP
jgi:hypothetical protein